MQRNHQQRWSRRLSSLQRGTSYRDKGEHDLAIADYTKAIEINPRHRDAYFNRGYAYRRKGDLSDEFSRGKVPATKGDYEYAIADFSKAIEIDPKRNDAYDHRGITHEALGRRADAIADYRQALALDPQDEFARDALKRLGASR